MNLRYRSFDFTLIVVPILLSIFGVVMVYSASIYSTVVRHEVDSNLFFIKQLTFLIISLVAFFVMSNVNYKVFKSNKIQIPMVLGAILSLLLLSIFGSVKGNAQGWFDFGIISFQPAEFCKLVMILYLAAAFHKKQRYINDINRSLMPPVIILITVAFLILQQPDFGSAAIILAIGFCIIICSGLTWKKISVIIAIILIILGSALTILFKFPDKFMTEEQQARITGYLHPFETGQDDGYQLVGSLLAIGNGGMTGVGFGESTQKYGYLPEAHTDSIIAVIAEEFGFIGVAFVLGSLLTIIVKGTMVAMRCKDPFGSMVAVGISSMIAIQSFVNLGGMTGLIPITGVTLPFVSYGGTSLLLTFISMGILVNISMQTERQRLKSG